jgi:competence protein ComEC
MNSLRSIWNQMPAVRLLTPFIASIILSIAYATEHPYLLWVVGGILLVACAVLIYINTIDATVRVYKWRYVNGASVLIAMCALGYIVTYFNTDWNDPHHIAHLDAVWTHKKAIYTGIIIDPIVVRDKTISALIALQKISQNDTSIQTQGKVLASISKDNKSARMQYGDMVVFSGEVVPYEDPKNPDQFDYKSYQALHHIYHRVYLRDGDWGIADTSQGNPVLAAIYRIRTYFLSLILQTVKGTNELAVATAIMLGYRDYISDDIMQAYAGSGVLHVLSVSGLHVAVLYYVLNLLLGWMDRRRRLEIAKGILVIMIMLFYAGLTGLSPPVLRSVWMFTLITIARLLDRDVSMYNILGVSCLVLLIWDPYYIADVGFQLSYIAVAGIVYLYPLLHALLPVPSFAFRSPFGFAGRILAYVFDFVWGLICVSIAAQIATFPISLYYFHTFPNFFLLSNLLVIPLSNLVLISGMILFAAGGSQWLMITAGWVFDHLLIVLNKIVFWIDVLPFALSRGMMITAFEMTLLYVLIILACWYIADRRAKVLLVSLVCLLVLCTAFSAGSIRNDQMKKLMVYNVAGKKAIAFIIRGQAYYDFDSALIHNVTLMRYNIRTHWWRCEVKKETGIDSTNLAYELPYGRLYVINNKRILVVDKEIVYSKGAKLKADIVIISANTNNTMADVGARTDFKEVVFDTSNKPAHIKHWIQECMKKGIKYHDCRDRAYEVDL